MATALCRDTAGWTNPYGDGCARFVSDGHCGDGGFRAGHEWARGAGCAIRKITAARAESRRD